MVCDACTNVIIKHQVSKVKQTLNVAAVSLLPRETRQLICYQVGYVWGTAAHPTSRLLYLSQAVRVEWPHRTTHYGNMSSGCCGECSCPQVRAPLALILIMTLETLGAVSGEVKGRVYGAWQRKGERMGNLHA